MAGWTPQDLALYYAERAKESAIPVVPSAPRAVAAKRDTTKSLNRTEQSYADYCERRLKAGEIARWRAQRVTLLIGFDCRLTVDFLITHNDGRMEFVDTKAVHRGKTKAHIEDDAKAKMSAAAEQFPELYFSIAWKDATGEWLHKAYNPLGVNP